MSKSAVPRGSKDSDNLRNLLDTLAERAVSTILADKEATPRAMSDVLKIAGTYWALSRKESDYGKAPNAWQGYTAAMTTGNGKDHDAQAN